MVQSRLMVILVLVFSVLVGCEDKSETDLFKAQLCIDNANAANVNACLNQIEGDTSKRAAVLRCSAAFISEDITDDSIVRAIENLKGDQEASSTSVAIEEFAMSSPEASDAAVNTCEKTESESLIALANFANFATVLTPVLNALGLGGACGDDVQCAIDAFDPSVPGNADDEAALGAAISASSDSLCDPTTGLFKSSDACTDLKAAQGNGSNNQQIGNKALCFLKADDDCATCQCEVKGNGDDKVLADCQAEDRCE